MWAKVLTQVIIQLVSSFASWAWKKSTSYFERKKRVEETQETAQKVEDAKTPDDIRAAADDLP